MRKIANHSLRDERLSNNDAVEIGPTWSPDGAAIAFSSDYNGDHEIYIMNSHVSGLDRLADNQIRVLNRPCPMWPTTLPSRLDGPPESQYNRAILVPACLKWRWPLCECRLPRA